jgi:hypothetical protein
VPKYYKAKVKLEKIVEVTVSADNEANAKRRAKSLAISKNENIPFKVVSTDLTFQRECKFEVGQMIKHPFFGNGKILELKQMTNMAEEISDHGKIEFEDGSIKDIAISMVNNLEIIEEKFS